MTTINPVDLDWRASSRQWESRAKTNLTRIVKLEKALHEERERATAWRSAYKSLEQTLAKRLDRIAEILEEDFEDDATTEVVEEEPA